MSLLRKHFAHFLPLVLPAGPLTPTFRRLARGGTIALVNRAQAADLRSGRLTATGLAAGVLITCPPSTVLAGLACEDDEPRHRHRRIG